MLTWEELEFLFLSLPSVLKEAEAIISNFEAIKDSFDLIGSLRVKYVRSQPGLKPFPLRYSD